MGTLGVADLLIPGGLALLVGVLAQLFMLKDKMDDFWVNVTVLGMSLGFALLAVLAMGNIMDGEAVLGAVVVSVQAAGLATLGYEGMKNLGKKVGWVSDGDEG